MTDPRPFRPDWVSVPGDTIADLLEERGWSQQDLATRTGFTKKHVNDLVRGKVPISPEAAQRLSTVLGSTTEFWLTREAKYRAGLEHERALEAHAADAGWLAELPVAWMVSRGLIASVASKPAKVDALLRWFGVASVPAWRETYAQPLAAFRASVKVDKRLGAVAAWLRAAELEAATIDCAPFNVSAFREALVSIRALAAEADPQVFVPQLQSLCAACGVAVVFVPAPPGCPIHGATRWLTSDKALLALSVRYKSNDQLWFSFFHEAAHLIKHGKKLLVIEGLDGLDQDKEDEANRFAADVLVPPEHASQLQLLRTEAEVSAYAGQVGVAPGILVGRMQHDRFITHAQMNGLKVRYAWAEETARV
ncbi:MAG: helix-turn-helix domain-containing protein [Gemmatimonadota bacterium]